MKYEEIIKMAIEKIVRAQTRKVRQENLLILISETTEKIIDDYLAVHGIKINIDTEAGEVQTMAGIRCIVCKMDEPIKLVGDLE